MQFLNPLALVGLAAALIPLVIHLLNRGRPRVVPFSHLAFLRELHQTRMRSVRLRQWLVLLLRMLALMCLALAFARPALQEGSSLFSSSRPTTAVVLLDRSWSTRYSPPGGRVFDRLRQRADQVLSTFDASRDQVYLLPWPGTEASAGSHAVDIETARQMLDEVLPGDLAGGLPAALRQARTWLDGVDGRQRELYLLTDRARPDWQALGSNDESAALADVPLPDVPVYILNASDSEPQNQFVGPLQIEHWLAAPGRKLAIHTTVGRWGGPQGMAPVTAHLYLDGERVQQRRVEVPRDGGVPVSFSVAPRRSGLLTGFVEIDDGGLAVDNQRYFTLDVPASISVVIAGPRATDTYYPRRALHAATGGDPTLSVVSVTLNDLTAAQLQAADVLVLANINTAPRSRVVRDFASAGGGVLVIPGPEADAAALNRGLLADLVPASLASISGRPGSEAFTQLDTTNLGSALFAGLLGDDADRPRFHATFAVTAQQQLAVLAHFDNGQPAMVEGRGPGGHALLWPTPLDLGWSDVPLRGLFVPLMQRMVRYLARANTHSGDYLVGARAWRRLPPLAAETKVEAESPSGKRSVVQSEAVGDEQLWRVPALNEAGIWRLRTNGAVADVFAVNVDVAEADLTPASDELIRRRLGPEARLLAPGMSAEDEILDARFGRELWREFLVLAVLLLLAELWIGRAPSE